MHFRPPTRYSIFWIVVFLLAALSHRTAGQGAYRCKKVASTPVPFTPDTLSLVPGSIFFPSDTGIRYNYNLNTNALSLRGHLPPDSLLICYRVFPLLLTKTRFRRSVSAYDSNALFVDEGDRRRTSPAAGREQLFSTPGLNKTGSLSRGISVGNTQNVFVNSALNLQLEGRLSESLKLTAVISDQNVPFQPQGNTQNIREFDKVYIRLDHKNGSLLAGDIVLQNPDDYFLRYYKNVQGGLVTVRTGDSLHGTLTTAAASAAKGKFYSQAVQPQEGVQGPYRLSAPNGELFIQVLANSEKVWLDGKLLRRGFGADYIIDYNQGEITFNNTLLLTKYSRIRVDYEYSERNYNRSIVAASHSGRANRLSYYVNYYREADDPSAPLGFSPDSTIYKSLSALGSNINNPIISGAVPVSEYNPDQILYTKTDTLGDSVYVYIITKAERMYSVSFTDVGQGNGDYKLWQTAANGKIYRFAGKGAGQYSPLRQVVTPKLKSMATAGAAFRLDPAQQFYTEAALNNNNVNRYAPASETDKSGTAFRAGYRNTGKPLFNGYTYSAAADYEHLDAQFDSVDRFRPVDFNRDWNANSGNQGRATDDIFTLSAAVRKNPDNFLSLSSIRRIKGSNVNGFQHRVEAAKAFGLLKTTGSLFKMNNNRPDYQADWLRFSGQAQLKTPVLQPTYRYTTDQNQRRQTGTERISGTTMNYTEHKFSLRSADSVKNLFAADYALRNDKDTLAGTLQPATTARTATLSASTKTERNNSIGISSAWRSLQYNRPGQTQPAEETIMGRLDWAGDYLKRHLRSELTYTSGTGRELKREFRYVKITSVGDGAYQWIDYNHDGIQQLGEFVEAARPEDRLYIKVFVPTAEYIKAYTNTLSYRLNLNGPRNWLQKTGIKKQLALLTNTTGYTAERKITSQNIAARFNPFGNVPDPQMLSVSGQLRSTFFWNRNNPAYGADFALLRSEQKTLLTEGFDARSVQENKLNIRLSLGSVFSVQPMLLQALRRSSSDFMSNRNYKIQHYEAAPQLVWQPSSTFRLTGAAGYASKNNLQGAEKAGLTRISVESRLNKVSVRTVSLTLRYTRISYQGNAQLPVAYEMLEALNRGNNLTWTLNLQQRLTAGLQLNLNYEGRKSEGGPPVHLGKVQVTALF